MAGEKSNFLDAGILALIFNGTGITGLAANAASPLTTLYVSLHTADPTAAGTQASSEVTYTSYAREGVARNGTNWVVTGQTVNPAANITFPTGTGGGGTASFWAVGVAASGATNFLYAGPINPPIVCGSGVTPTLTTATSVSEG